MEGVYRDFLRVNNAPGSCLLSVGLYKAPLAPCLRPSRLLHAPAFATLRPTLRHAPPLRCPPLRSGLGEDFDTFPFQPQTQLTETQENVKAMLEQWGIDEQLFYATVLAHPSFMYLEESDVFVRIMSLSQDDLHLTTRHISEMLRRCPEYLLTDGPALTRLSDWLLERGVASREEVGAIVRRCPEVLLLEVSALQERADWLAGHGVQSAQLGPLVLRCPQLLLSSTQELRAKVDWLVDQGGVEREHVSKIIVQFPQLLDAEDERVPLHLQIHDAMDEVESEEEWRERMDTLYQVYGKKYGEREWALVVDEKGDEGPGGKNPLLN